MKTGMGRYRPHITVAGGFSPTDISGLQLWLDPSDTATITESSGSVSQIDDKSGNGRHYTQGTGTRQPTTGTRTINSLNTLDFDGSSDALVAPSAFMSAATAGTALYVMASDNDPGGADPGNGAVLHRWGSSASSDHEPYLDSNVYHGWGATTRKTVGNPTPALTTPRQITITNASGAWAYKIDGTDIFTTGTNTVGFASALSDANSDLMSIGGSTAGAAPVWFNGRIAEILVYDSALSGADLTNAQTYLKDKWGTA